MQVSETYPSGRVVNNEFESDGDLARIYGKANTTATEQTYATSFSYTPDGKIERLKLGNGLWEAAKFNTRLQTTEIALGHGVTSGDLWKLNYDYGELNTDGTVNTAKNTGNIAKQTVSFNGLANPLVQAYNYDSLYRLTQAKETSNGTQTWIQQFGYDRYGNRSSTAQTINAVNINTTPAVDANTNRFTSTNYHYDKNGNLTTDIGQDSQTRTITFNGDNKQTEVKDANGNSIGKYYFDGEGKRIKKVTATETTVYVYSSGKLIAEYSNATPPSNPTTNYTATDMLGSPRVLTNSLGEVVSRRDFLPFGEEIFADGTNRTTALKFSQTGQDSVRKRFTGYEKDTETGLDFAEARMYENRNGRFTAVDPLLASGKSANPQTFNRYVYGLNRPLILKDPTGLQAGDWYMPVKPDESGQLVPDESRAYTYINRGASTAGYQIVSLRNQKGEFIGYSPWLDNNHVYRFNPYGPYRPSSDPMSAAAAYNVDAPQGVASPGLIGKMMMSDYQFKGYDEIATDEYENSSIEHPADGYAKGSEQAITPLDVALFCTPFKFSVVGRTASESGGSGISALTKFFPENNGFVGETKREFLTPGQLIDRYGSSQGRYFSPSGTPIEMRSLPPSTNTNIFTRYRVLRPFEVNSGTVAPAFGRIGCGTQFQAPRSASELVRRGILDVVDH